jgi:Lon protease-like protein
VPFELPLFPLNTVLFPNVKLPLHIFEERYRLMIERCLDADRQFGVVLISDGVEVGEPAVPHRVGTVARIVDVVKHDDGTMNLAASGENRFELIECWEMDGYLQGQVELFTDGPEEAETVRLLGIKAHAMFDRYVSMLAGDEFQKTLASIPNDPSLLSFLISAALPISLDGKQLLLELKSTVKRLEQLCGILRQQIVIREVIERARARTPPKDNDWLSSLN